MITREYTFRLEIHLFKEKDRDPEVQIWEKKRLEDELLNPLLLKVETWEGTQQYLFSLSGWEVMEDNTAVVTYYPYATHEKLDLIKDLPEFGFVLLSSEEILSKSYTLQDDLNALEREKQ